MSDWRNTQYRIGSSPDPLAESDDFSYGIGGVVLFLVFVGCIGALVMWLL
ncbi:MAG TPA: hypothetical protein VNM48_04025 [Chloroflexota bacterium]|nr:hypothetical protein [Chloroflexota bacterium]